MEDIQAWNEVKTQDDVDMLMEVFGDFHDSCLRELHLWTEHYVAPDLSMGVGLGLDRRARLLFQRQWEKPSAIELYFEEILGLNVAPSPIDYESIIYSATLLLTQDRFYWADQASWSPDDKDKNQATWIAAQKLRWRDVSHWMGNELRYGPKE